MSKSRLMTPRLDYHVTVLGIHFQNAVHAGKGNLDTVGMRDSAPAQPGSRAAAHHRHAGLPCEGHHPAHLVGVQRKHHGVGHSPVYGTVVFEHQQVVRVPYDIAAPDNLPEPVNKSFNAVGGNPAAPKVRNVTGGSHKQSCAKVSVRDAIRGLNRDTWMAKRIKAQLNPASSSDDSPTPGARQARPRFPGLRR